MPGTRPRSLSILCLSLVIIVLLAVQVLSVSAAATTPAPTLKSIAATAPLNADRIPDIQQVDVNVPEICFIRTLISPVEISEGDADSAFAVIFSNFANPIGVTIVSQDDTQLVGDPASFTDIIRSLTTPQLFGMRTIEDSIDEPDTEYTLRLVFSGGSVCETIDESIRTVTFRILDDDPPLVTITAQDASAAEAGSDPGTFRITRTAGDTSADLVVAYTIGGTADSTDYTPALTGTATILAGQTFVDVTITPVDDSTVELDETVTLTLTDGADYDLGASTSASITITSEDLPLVTIAAQDASAAEAGSDSGTFRISRTGPTTSALSVDYTLGGTAAAGDYIPTLTGTVSIPIGAAFVDLAITPDDDLVDEADPETVTLTLTDTAAYDLGVPSSATVNIADDDTAGVTVTESGGSTAVSESGTTDSFTVVLNSQPTADVIVDLASSDASEATVSPLQLTFTSANWNTPQPVTVTGVDDLVADGAQPFTITTTVTSADPLYAAINPADVSGTTSDDDAAGVTVTESGGSTAVSESGTTDSFTVVLNSQPTADVIVDLASSDASEATVSPLQLTFTSANWNTPQPVTVTGVDDLVADGAQPFTITTTVTSADPLYAAINPADVSGTTSDDDAAGVTVTVTESGGSTAVSESGTTDSFTVVLNSQPTADVSIALTGSQVTTSVPALTFTPANWNTAQPVIVTAVDDVVSEGTHAGSVSLVVTSADALYASAAIPALPVTITDNDSAGVLITPLAIALSEGSAGAASVVLTSPPSAGSVTIPVTFDPANLTLNGDLDGVVELVFTAANWNAPVGLTIATLANGTPDDARLSMIGFQISASDAPEYPVGSLPSIQVTIADVPPPPSTPLCEAHNFDEGGVVRSSIADALGHAINCRILYQNGASTTWLGGALYGEANLGVPGLLELGVQQAVDIFSPGGRTYFEGGAVFCLRGQGTLIWLAASAAPRIPAIIGSYTVPDFPGFTCATLFEPGTLVLVADNPVD